MKRFFKTISFMVVIVFSFSFLVSCTKKKEPQTDLKTVRLSEVVRSIFYAPMYAAINQGFFKEEGIKIELSTAQGADKTAQQVLSKNADIGFSGPEQIIYLYNQGREDHGVVFAQLTQKDGSFLVARNDKNFNWNNVKGKTIIGGRPGGVPQMALEHVLKKNGINPAKDVKIITNLAFNATAGAFKSGTGDYIAAFEPTGSLLEKEKVGTTVASIGKDAGDIAYTSFFTTNEYIKSNKDTIQGFTNAIYKGQLWVEKTPSKDVAKSIIDFFPGSDIEVLSKIIDRYKEINAFSKTPNVSSDGLNNLMNIIEGYNKDLIKKRPPIEKISTNEFANKTVKSIK
ncbi:ABC transporter substrate-binding protein [Clostridium cylindrosporum]|uniref:ABC-type nitrate/sulfonate/bicarbonate transport system, periplasmic component n=1 Tax=Clostridium cylindrosporum DSM 605 TaxID=1121307 RepID=A0A0J8DA13_CLOCY|nr:ABC transporter substrate-binding protein [Clostridium cylindrosporum]KMT22687.1 ABC-type nitrate/sulfonate/bicarbonate transport system, periplasmic component [Clostridium cylindrosporum DSM 605]